MNRKYLTFIILILVVTATAFGLFFWKWKERWENKAAMEKANRFSELLPSVECNFQSDGRALDKAVSSKNLAYCACIKDESKKMTCEKSVLNVSYYEQALTQYDEKICAEIAEDSMRKACISVVKKGVESLKKSDPDQLGYHYLQNGNYIAAQEVYETLLKTDSGNLEYLLNLALAYANQGLLEHNESKMAPKALSLVLRALELGENPEAYRIQGFIYETIPDLKKAEESYGRALALNSNYIPAYIGRGHAFVLQGDLPRALEDFYRAAGLDRDRQYGDIYSNLCNIESNYEDKLESAIKNCRLVVESVGANSRMKIDALSIISDIYMNLGKFDEAHGSIQRMLTFDPKNSGAFISWARLYNLKKEYKLAEEKARLSLKIDQGRAAAYSQLAQALLGDKRFDEAISVAKKGLEIVEGDVSLIISYKNAVRNDLYSTMSSAYEQKGDDDNANKYKQMIK